MSRTAIPVQPVPPTGRIADVDWTEANDETDHEFVNDGNSLLLVRVGGAAPKTVSIIGGTDPVTGLKLADISIATTNGDISISSPLKRSHFNQAGGVVHVDLETAADVEFAVVSLTL